jgi:hypothetical protein
MDKTSEQLKQILGNNPDLLNRIQSESWEIKYRKDSDMILMGAKFPSDTFYFDVKGSGVLVRIDDDKKIYGFAIENFKYFTKKNPEFRLFYFLIAHPFQAYALYILIKSLDKMRMIKVVSEYVAGQAVYA